MSEQFKVGEVCIGQNFTLDLDRNKMECEVLESAEYSIGIDSIGGLHFGPAYFVRWADGQESSVAPCKLRRKPPKQDLTEWAASKVRDLTKPVTQPEKEIA